LSEVEDQDDSGNVPIVPTLADLISEKRALRGFSYTDLEHRAGNVITRQRWQQLGTGVRVKEFSEPATIRAMAAALEVDESMVVLAMAKSVGLNVELGGAQSILARMLPAVARRLTAEQRNAIVGMVRVMGQAQSQAQQASADEGELGPSNAEVDVTWSAAVDDALTDLHVDDGNDRRKKWQ